MRNVFLCTDRFTPFGRYDRPDGERDRHRGDHKDRDWSDRDHKKPRHEWEITCLDLWDLVLQEECATNILLQLLTLSSFRLSIIIGASFWRSYIPISSLMVGKFLLWTVCYWFCFFQMWSSSHPVSRRCCGCQKMRYMLQEIQVCMNDSEVCFGIRLEILILE